jgi:hypothetical protein
LSWGGLQWHKINARVNENWPVNSKCGDRGERQYDHLKSLFSAHKKVKKIG